MFVGNHDLCRVEEGSHWEGCGEVTKSRDRRGAPHHHQGRNLSLEVRNVYFLIDTEAESCWKEENVADGKIAG